MSLHEQISADLSTAMKARDRERTAALRLVISALRDHATAQGRGPQGELEDAEVERILAGEIKRRLEAAGAYRDAGRAEQADAEEAEATVYASYLPEQLSDEELTAVVDEVIAEVGASDVKEMGQVMKAVMPRVEGRADGSRVSALVKERL